MSRYLVFGTAGIVLLMASISGTSVSVAFPVIISSFDTSLIVAAWVLGIYQLVSTAAMPLTGKASDALGRKFVFMLCISLFTIGSLLCALAPNIQLLILFRLIQAIGGGGFMPSASGVVVDAFPRARQQVLGLFSTILPVGQIIGPNLGGWMTYTFGWRSVFWVNIPLGVLALIASAFLLRSQPRGESQIDLVGAGLFAGSLSAIMVGLTMMGNSESALSWGLFLPLLAISIAFMIFFLRRQSRVKNPIIDMEVLRQKPFVAANFYNFMYGACVQGTMALLPLYLVSVYGMTTLESGLILTPKSVGTMVAATVTSIHLMRWGYRRPMLIGTAIIIAALLLYAAEFKDTEIFGIQLSGTFMVVMIMILIGVGFGITAPAGNNACIELMPDRVATIAGIRGMFRQSGGAISIAVASLVLHNVGDLTRGFVIVFIGLAVALFLTVPLIFLIPSAPKECPP